MNEQEAIYLAVAEGSTEAGTVKALTEMYKDISEYTQEDFLDSELPYEHVYLYRRDKFRQSKVLTKMAKHAKSVGVTNFQTLYRDYARNQPDDPDDIDGSYTNFSNQPISLRCGKWRCDDSGIFIHTENGSVCACPHPIMPVARLTNIETGIEKIKVAYRRGKAWRTVIFDRKTLSATNKIIDLADCGIAVTSENARDLVKYLHEVEQLNPDLIPEIECVTHLGWIEKEQDEQAEETATIGSLYEFVPYGTKVSFDGEAAYKKRFDAVKAKGDLVKWLEAMDKYIRQNPQPMARIVFASSLASVLIGLLDCNCYWLHLWGGTGTAKTVLTMCAASIWGNPERGQFLTTFDATVVGCEKSAAFSGSIPYMMDELQLVDIRKSMDQIIYMLTEGCGRTRGNKYGGIDVTSQWRNCVISTGERPINTASSGGGAMGRVIEVECKRPFFGDDESARKVLGIITQNYGFFGKVFIAKVAEKTREELNELYSGFYKQFEGKGIMAKQAQPAALILTADALACELYFDEKTMLTAEDLLPFLKTKDEVDVNARAYEYLCDKIAANHHRFVKSENNNTEMWGSLDVESNSVYIIRTYFDNLCFEGGYNSQALLSWLDDRGLVRKQNGKFTVVRRSNDGLKRCVHMTLFDEQIDESGADVDYIEI